MTSQAARLGTVTPLALAALLSAGCDADLPEYSQLEGFRVLALRASPPSLNAGESTTLDALAFVEDDANPSFGYRWSWCPARLPAAEGGDCALDEAEFAALLGLDGSQVDFALGEQATATLTYPGPPEAYQAACANAAGAGQPAAFVFSCEGDGFPVSVRADVTYRAQTIRIQKVVRFLFGGLLPNKNPELGPIAIGPLNGQAAPAPWPEDAVVPLPLGGRYQLQVAVDETSAERFVPAATVVDPMPKERLESLYISWFVSSGETEQDRTSFIAGGVTLAEFGQNEWRLPKAGDEARAGARLFLVLRDERGGVSWLARGVELTR